MKSPPPGLFSLKSLYVLSVGFRSSLHLHAVCVLKARWLYMPAGELHSSCILFEEEKAKQVRSIVT